MIIILGGLSSGGFPWFEFDFGLLVWVIWSVLCLASWVFTYLNAYQSLMFVWLRCFVGGLALCCWVLCRFWSYECLCPGLGMSLSL